VSCWGNGADGQLGRKVKRAEGSAVVIEDLSGVKQLAVGRSHGCALLGDGTVRCWGRNTEGQLGAGVTGSRASTVVVKDLEGVTQLVSGHLHTCGVRGDGSVACWGDNTTRQLGGDSAEPRLKIPVEVTAARDVELLAGGGRHTCARV